MGDWGTLAPNNHTAIYYSDFLQIIFFNPTPDIAIFTDSFLTLDIRTNMSDSVYMNGNELLKKLKGLGKQRGVTVIIEKHHGKGSHATLYFGEKRTTMKDRKKEIGKGLLNSMLTDLGIDKDEI